MGGTGGVGPGISRGDRGVGGDTCGEGVDGAGPSKVSVGAGSTGGDGEWLAVGNSELLLANPFYVASLAILRLPWFSTKCPCAGALVGLEGRPDTTLLLLSFLAASTATPRDFSTLADSSLPALLLCNAPALTFSPVLIGSYPVAFPNS